MSYHRPRDRDGFDFAIICALEIECNAVEALLDEVYEMDDKSYKKAPTDKNSYTTGRFGKQHVVVLCMPYMGPIVAAAVASDLRLSFQKIKVAFVVGICGGTPRSNSGDEILLGDVIVSASVVQIDFGRQYPDGLQPKEDVEDVLGRASLEIKSFVRLLSGYRCHKRLEDKTSTWSAQVSSLKGFSSSAYPGPEFDVLYDSEYRHKHRISSCNICDQCHNSHDDVCDLAVKSGCDKLGCQGIGLEHRPRVRKAMGIAQGGQGVTEAEMQEARKPAIHFGRMACGNQVIKSGVHRDYLATRKDIIGFEMESAGIWDHIPTIVVKSVCDYADSHKDDKWKPYAAATAAACTKALLEEWRSTDGQDPGSTAHPNFPIFCTVTRPVNGLFTGRHKPLCELESFVRDARKAIEDPIQSELCHIVVSGMPGQGKSEICLKLTERIGTLFCGVFWIDVSTTSLAHNGFLDIARCLGEKAQKWEEAKRMLVNLRQPWLLVLDNADHPEVDYSHYIPASTFGIVILTSRNTDCGKQYATGKWIDLEGLADEDAQLLLFKASGIPDTSRESLKGAAQDLVRLLRSHPLALIQAASYIGRRHCSLADYPQEYDRHRKRLLEFKPSSQAQSRFLNVYATFEASAEIMEASDTAAAGDALQLLSILAFYGPDRLPESLFEMSWAGARFVPAGGVEDDCLSSMTKWHFESLPTFLQISAEAWDPFELKEALNLLDACSLVSIIDRVGEPSRWISMHPLIQAWARDRLSPGQQHVCWVQAGILMALISYNDAWHDYGSQLQPHIQAVTSWSMSRMFVSDPAPEMCRILIRCGYLLRDIRDDTKLSTLMESVYSHFELDRQVVDVKWIDLYQLFGQNLRCCGRTSQAVKLLEQVVSIREQTVPDSDPSRLLSQHVLSVAYRENGQVDDAISLLEQIVKVGGRTLTDSDPIQLGSQHALARAYCETGRVKDSIVLLEQVVKTREQTLLDRHFNRLSSQDWLGRAYHKNGQYEEAITLLERVVKRRGQTLSDSNPDQLSSRQTLAMCLWEVGTGARAIIIMRDVVRIRRDLLDERHPDRVLSEECLKRYESEMGID